MDRLQYQRALVWARASLFALAAALASNASADDVLVRLVSGDCIRGTIVERTGSAIVVRHSVLGDLTIPNAQVTELRPIAAAAGSDAPRASAAVGAEAAGSAAPASVAADSGPSPEVLPVGSGAAASDGRPDATLSKPPKGPWSASIAVAVNYTDNNDTTIDARLAAGAEYKVQDIETLSLSAEYFFKTLNASTTDNNLLINGVYDRYIERSPWLWFVKGQYQYSQFEAWEHRLSGYAGVGYQVFERPPLNLLLKIGAGGTHEFGPPEQTLPEGYGEVQCGWDITQSQELLLSANIAPDLSDLGEYRIISRAEWLCTLDPALDLALTIGVRSQYQSQVPPGDVNHDLRLYAGLKLGF